MNCYVNNYNQNKYGIYENKNFNLGVFMNEVPICNEYGFIEIQVTKNLGSETAIGALLSIYVNQNENQIPIVTVPITQNPTIIRLPIANPLGTLVKGPEYYFTPYNLTIESEGYYRVVTQNIRLFPNITVKFLYNLNKIVPGSSNQEQITIIPPHPRDVIY